METDYQSLLESFTNEQLEAAAVAAETWKSKTSSQCALRWAGESACGEPVL